MPFNLSGKVAVVSGSSSGIGRAIAVALAKEGAFVTITGRDGKRLKEVAQECQENGLANENVLVVKGNICERETCEKIVSETLTRFGKLDVLVNNAGVFRTTTFDDLDLNDFDDVFDVNVKAAICLSKFAIPHLLNSKGNIVNISSVSAFRPFPDSVTSSVSKAAIEQLTKCLAIEYAERGVRVNSVIPGYIKTDLFKTMGVSNDKLEEEIGTLHPMKRCGDPEEIANAVLFLVSDKASFTTGASLAADGGYLLATPRLQSNYQKFH